MVTSNVRLGSIDLNLLTVFDAVARERSVTRAGNQLGLSQSAISHALARLRYMLKDELFISSPRGMVPTPRAEQLARPVREALDGLERSLEPSDFDPAKATTTFRIAVNNCSAVIWVAPLVQRVRAAAPGVMLDIVPSGEINVTNLLDDRKLDLAIGMAEDRLQRFSYLHLRQEGYVAIMCKGSAGSRRQLSLTEFITRQHLEISSIHPAPDFVDEALASHKLARKVALRVPLLAAAPTLCDSDLIAVVPSSLADELTRRFPGIFAIRKLPIESHIVETVAVWPRWLDDQPAHIWLRENVRLTVESLIPSEGRSARIGGRKWAEPQNRSAARNRKSLLTHQAS